MGGTLTMTSTSSDGATNAKTFASATASVATITNAGVVTPVAAGTTQITSTINGVTSAPVTLTVVDSRTIAGQTVTTAQAGTTVPFASLFTVGGTSAPSASDFTYTVTGGASKGTVSTAGVLTIANTATGPVQVVATAKSASNITSGSPATATVTTVTTAKTVNGKAVPAGKVGGDVIPVSDLFAFSGAPTAATISDASAITVVPSGAGTWSNSTGLTLSNTASGNVTLTYNVGTGVIKGTTVPTVTGVTPKVTNFTAVGAPTALAGGSGTANYTLDGGTVASPAAATTLTLTAVPSGAVLATPVAGNVTNSDNTIASHTITGGKVVITPLAKAGTTNIVITLNGVSRTVVVTVAA